MQFFAISCYFLFALTVAICSFKKKMGAEDFLIGGRSMNRWLTAMAAHASDMSNWLFMGYPAMIFIHGLSKVWIAVGLILCMFLNWKLIAPKIRVMTEKLGCLTLSSFFEKSVGDTSGFIRVFTALISIFFYSVYISAGLMGLGKLMEILFQMSYVQGITLGVSIVIAYVLFGGYLTLAWLDLFQGIFLFFVIMFVPLFVGGGFGWVSGLEEKVCRLIPEISTRGIFGVGATMFGWGLGYFGQPHILTKFMGIRSVKEIASSKWIGMGWMVISLGSATAVGLVGYEIFAQGLADPEMVFVEMVRQNFSPFLVGLFLCAIIAAIINVVCSQILVLSSTVTEDLCAVVLRRKLSSNESIWITRVGIVAVALLAFGMSYARLSSIYEYVFYAWSGLGATFGPLLLYTLYSQRVNKYSAWAGLICGGVTAATWPYFNRFVPLELNPMLPGFCAGLFAIWLGIQLSTKKQIAIE